VILLDTSGLLSAIDASQSHHEACARVVTDAESALLVSPFVLAELDCLLGQRVGLEAQTALLDEVARGAYRLEPFEPSDVARARELMRRYSSLRLGLTDASIVVLADRYGAKDILTLDERHFRAIRASDRRLFRLLPADE
jgi:predicted nucleic acid-binding protein